jgi:acyl CoA:acetate/3-ketoacid CoA transferase beta subunit
VTLQSENGMLGIGPFPMRARRRRPHQRRQADHQRTAAIAYFDSAASFAMIRGGIST